MNYNERNMIENGFLDEFKLAMANLQANNAAGGGARRIVRLLRDRHRHRRRCRSTWPTSTADATPANPAAYTRRRTGPTPRSPAASSQAEPEPVERGAAISTATRRAAPTRSPPGLPANFFVLNPDVNSATSPTAAPSATTTRCSSSCAGGCRAAVRSTAATSTRSKSGSAVPRLHYGRVIESDRQRPPRDQDRSGTGRCRSAAASGSARTCNPVLNGVVGGWSFNGNGRVQARTHRTSATSAWSG